MEPSESLFAEVSAAAAGKLSHPESLRALIDVAVPDHATALHAIGFSAKFLVKTWNVMRRLGSEDPAREQLKIVFQEELDGVRTKISDLASLMPADDRQILEAKFLTLSSAAFVDLLALLQDLSWLKNIEIDRR